MYVCALASTVDGCVCVHVCEHIYMYADLLLYDQRCGYSANSFNSKRKCMYVCMHMYVCICIYFCTTSAADIALTASTVLGCGPQLPGIPLPTAAIVQLGPCFLIIAIKQLSEVKF